MAQQNYDALARSLGGKPAQTTTTDYDALARSLGGTPVSPVATTDTPPSALDLVLETVKQVGRDLNPLELVRALTDAATSDLGRTLGPAGAQVELAKRMVVDPARETFGRAREAFQEGRYSEAAGYGAASALPLVGPMAAQIGEKIGSGDPTQQAQAVGHAISGMLPVGVYRAARARAPMTAQQATARTVTADVPLTVAERTGSPIASFAEGVTERTIPGSSVYGRFRDRQQASLQQAADQVVDRLSQTTARTPEEVGLTVQRALDEAKQSMRADLSARYAEIDTLTAGITVPTASLKAVVRPMLQRIRAEGQLIPPQELSRTTQILERIASAPRQLPFRAFQDARSDLLAITRSFGDPLPGKAAGVAKRLAAETDAAMMGAAERSGVEGLVSKVRDANAQTKLLNERFNDTVIKKLIDADPEKVPSYVRGADLASVRELAATIPAETMDTVRASIVRDMLNKSTQGELSSLSIGQQLGLTAEGRPVSTPKLSGASLRRQLESLGEPKLETLFGRQVSRDLREIAAMAERIAPRAASQARGLIAAGVNASIFSWLLSPLGVNVMTGVQAAGTYGAFNALARVLTTQRGAQAYRSMLEAMSSGNTRKATAAGLAVTRLLQDDDATSGESEP